MENTTKALIMAAGVLLAIIILSLTIYLVNSFKSFTQEYNENLEKQQLDKFNSNFTVFQGRNNIAMHEITTLVNLAKKFNTTNNLTKDDSQYIHIYAKIKNQTIDLTLKNNSFIDSLLDGTFIEEQYSTNSEIQNNGGQYRIENEYSSDKSKKTKIIYYNCYSCESFSDKKDCYINEKTGRVEYITFIFYEKVVQNL